MKKITKCYGCGQVVRLFGSFTAQVEEEVVIGGINTGEVETKTVKLCRCCASEAGYKVKGRGVAKELA